MLGDEGFLTDNRKPINKKSKTSKKGRSKFESKRSKRSNKSF